MLKPAEGKIDIRGLVAFSCITVGFKVTDMTATILYQEVKNSAWIVPIITGLILLLPLFCLFSIFKRHPGQTLIDVIYQLTGKYIGFFISMILFLIALTGSLLSGRNYIDILSTMFFPRTPIAILLVLGWSTSYLIASRGFESIGRSSWLFFFWIKFSFALMIVLAWRERTTEFVYPILGPGIPALLKTSITSVTFLGEFILFAVFFPLIRSYKDYKNGTLLSLGITVFELSIFYLVYVFIFDYPTISQIAFPFHQLSTYITAGRFFTNLESFFLPMWVIGGALRFALYLYVTTFIFANTLKIQEYEPLLLPMTGFLILIGLVPENAVKITFFYRSNIFMRSTWIILIGLPILLWGIDRLKERHRSDT